MKIKATLDICKWFYRSGRIIVACSEFVEEFFGIKPTAFKLISISVRKKNPKKKGWIKVSVNANYYTVVNDIEYRYYSVLDETIKFLKQKNLHNKSFWIKIEEVQNGN